MNDTPAQNAEPGDNHSVNVTVNVNTDPAPVASTPPPGARFYGYVLVGLFFVGVVAFTLFSGGTITFAIP